jgi:voltage-gated potassium channel
VVRRTSAVLDLVLSPLALVTLVLLLIEFTVRLHEPWGDMIVAAQLGIWALFLLAFALELALAPHKLLYLKEHWLLVVSLAIPALRILRVLRACASSARHGSHAALGWRAR